MNILDEYNLNKVSGAILTGNLANIIMLSANKRKSNMLIWITPLGMFIGLILYKIFFNGFKVEV